MSSNLIWVDLEMTGLDPEHNVIIEIATIVTDTELNVVAEGPNLAINQPESALSLMDDWNLSHHSESGLLSRVRDSEISQKEAEAMTLEFVSHYSEKNQSPLCGNSIWQDRRFLIHHMPVLESFFHYRIIDVSSFKELVLRWNPSIADLVSKQGSHRALDDIKESIEELRVYRDSFLRVEKDR